jgi:oligopeptide transport system substrate-binding protein
MRLRVTAVFALLALGIAGCSDSPERAEPGVLTVGVREPTTLLPADVHDQAGRMITGALWTPLVSYEATTGKVTPRAAESVGSSDQVTWTVRLRTRGHFHDGTPLTAKSYVDTWQAVAGEHWPGSAVLTETLRAKEITAPDENTLKIVLDRPFGQVPAVLAAQALLPLPASVLASRDWAGFAHNPVGNGPFRLAEPWKAGSGGRLTRVADVPGKAREIKLRVGDPAAQYDDVKAGKLDLAVEVPGDRHDAMHHDFAERHAMWPLPEATYLAFPLADKRFQDAAVRYGFAMSTDRAALETGALTHQADPARTMLPPAVAPGERTGTCRPCTHDPAAAKSLLTQAAFIGGSAIYYDAGQAAWATALADQVHGALGAEVTAKPRASTAPDGPFTVSVALGTPSPHELLAALVKATGYADDGFAQLLASAEAAGTPEEAGRAYRLVENQLLRDLPAAPLWSGHGHTVWTQRVRDVSTAPFTGIDLAEVGC